MRLAAIIQARMGSKRLPGKVMMNIAGKPLLWYVIDRTKMAVENVIVATPDETIANFAKSQAVLSFIGDENDVLDRYYQAASYYKVEHIIRITADNPLIDPEMIKSLIKFYFEGDYDWASNCRLKITFPVGNDAEIFSFKALERTWNESTDPWEAECVTAYIYRHPELFKLGILENKEDLSDLRWTVDTLEDLEHVKMLIAVQSGKIRSKYQPVV